MFKLLSRNCHNGTLIKIVTSHKVEVRNPKIVYIGTNLSGVRFSSAAAGVPSDGGIIDSIPEPPPIPEITEELIQISANGEPTFASLGLGGYSPVGLVQNCFEYLHITLDVPWWGAILIGTACVRLAMFPLVVIAQRNTALLNNHMPKFSKIQEKVAEARQRGNIFDTARYNQELMMFMKEKKINPIKNAFVPLAQGSCFVSFYLGIRGMVNCPVESLSNGGLFWFTDLTVPDQYYLLPVITSLTMWATIELGADGINLNSPNMRTMKYVLRAIPFIMLPFTMNFPGAVLLYWCSSNFISLAQVGMLKTPAVRKKLNIPIIIRHDREALSSKSKGFVGGIKDWWQEQKIQRELSEMSRIDSVNFTRAGQGPIQKTYKIDPTKITVKKD